MIRRSRQLRILARTLGENPIAALLGPRQCGKTTLARQLAERRKRVHFFALEQVLSLVGGHQAFFWATHSGAELDLLLLRGGRRFGLEFMRFWGSTSAESAVEGLDRG